MAKKDYEKAVQCYTEALDIDPTNRHMKIMLWSNRALAYNGVSQPVWSARLGSELSMSL